MKIKIKIHISTKKKS